MKNRLLAALALLALAACDTQTRAVVVSNEVFIAYYYKATGETSFYLAAACHVPQGQTIQDYCGAYTETARLSPNGCVVNWDTGVEQTNACTQFQKWGPGQGPKIPQSAFPEAIYPASMGY